MRDLGIEMQTVLGMPPVDHVRLAAELDCPHIAIALGPMPWNPCNFPAWSLREDAGLRREMAAAMRDTGVRVSLAEGFAVRPGTDVRERAADMDLVVGLGAPAVGAVSMEPDLARGLDQLATLAEMAGERGIGLDLEFAPPHPIGTLDQALAAIRHIGRGNVRLTVDAMHFIRSGASVADLAAIDPALIGHFQLCDVPLAPPHDDYMREAVFERLVPGEGELPLCELVAALPARVPIGVEVPMKGEVEAGHDIKAVVARIVAGGKAVLERCG